MTDNLNHLDIAIVGGGISGIYTAWRLINEHPELKIKLFEASDRIGGRLLSVKPPELKGFRAELGGMRYLTNQARVQSLVEKLNLKVRPFPVGQDDNIYYLRGQHLRQDDFDMPEAVPYRMSWLERGKSPGQLIAEAIDAVIPGAAALTAEQWQDVKKNYSFDGKPLYNSGFWNVLHTVMSSEAYKLVFDAGGYATTISNWNAAEAMAWYLADFGPTAKYMTLEDGYEALPRNLAEAYRNSGGQIEYRAQLTGIGRDGAGPDCQLLFADGSEYRAGKVVLAMPRRSLELIEPDGPFFETAGVADAIASVTPHPMFKLFLCYRYPWWQDAGVTVGRSVTDLPLRQVYYFGVEPPEAGHVTPDMRDSLLMASYDDGRHVGFWRGLAADEPLPLDDDPYDSPDRWNCYKAPPAMIAHAQRQLKLVHDLEYIPEPYAAAFLDWGQDPYGGAWNSWNIGVKTWEQIPRMIQPAVDWPVYICGEAYSSSQGWVEGALETADRVYERLIS
jgi:monoamine oxidase